MSSPKSTLKTKPSSEPDSKSAPSMASPKSTSAAGLPLGPITNALASTKSSGKRSRGADDTSAPVPKRLRSSTVAKSEASKAKAAKPTAAQPKAVKAKGTEPTKPEALNAKATGVKSKGAKSTGAQSTAAKPKIAKPKVVKDFSPGGILKIKNRGKRLTQAFIERKDGTSLVIPHEIFLQILEIFHKKSDLVNLICLSLVRKPFWKFTKQQLHKPKFLDLSIDIKKQLAPRLRRWMGSDFRQAGPKTLAIASDTRCNVMFVSREEYRAQGSAEEAAMRKRYNDCASLQIPQPVKGGEAKYFRLHSPFGQGVEWRDSSIFEILRKMRGWKRGSGSAWNNTVLDFWSAYSFSGFKTWVEDTSREEEDEDLEYHEVLTAKQTLQELEENFLNSGMEWGY